MLSQIYIGFLLSVALGALVGAQRESKLQKKESIDFAGFRSFTLISVLGFFLGFLSLEILKDNSLIFIGFFGVFALIISTYILQSLKKKKIETITSEVSGIIVFLVGLLVSLNQYYLAISLAISTTAILLFGDSMHKFAKNLKDAELFATLKFGIIAFVILPLLPNKNYSPLDIPLIGDFLLNQETISQDLLLQLDVFNLYHTWLIVVFISAIGYLGYILMKTIGARKGILTTGFLAGLMSSTAVTSSFAIESKNLKLLTSPLIVGTIIASSTMFIRILFEVFLIYPPLLFDIFLIFVIMGTTGYITSIYFFRKEVKVQENKIKVDSPFSLGPALKFGLFFLVITFFSKLFSILFGSSGIYLLAFFSGVADVDAITITLLTLLKQGEITNNVAIYGIVLASLANTLFKGGIAYYLGSKEFSKGVIISFSIIILVGIIGLFTLTYV